MKRIILALLVLCLLLPVAAPLALSSDDAQPEAEAATVVLSFPALAERIRKESPVIQNNSRTLLNILSNDARLSAAHAGLGASGGMSGGGLGDPMDMLMNTLNGMMTRQAVAQVAALNLTPSQEAIYRIQFEMYDTQVVQAGETLYLRLIQVQEGLERARRVRPLAEQGLLLAKTAESVGMGTESGTLSAALRVSDLDALISRLELGEMQLLFEMNKLLGIQYDNALRLRALPAPDIAYYEAIDLAADLRTAVKNSYRLRILEQERRAMTGSSEFRSVVRDRQRKDSEIELETQALGARMTLLYHTIANDRVALENQELRLKLAQADATAAQTAFEAGQISELAFKQAGEALQAQKDAVSDAVQTLFWNIRTYQWIAEGLSL